MPKRLSTRERLDRFDSRFRELAIREGIASFNLYRGLEHEDLNKIEAEMSALWRESATRTLASRPPDSPELSRPLQLIRLGILRNRVEGDHNIFTAKNEANQIVVSFQPQVDGQPISRTDLNELMKWEPDPEKRRRAAGAFVPLEAALYDKVMNLIEKRNRAARKLGYQSYPHLAFELSELDLEEVRTQLAEIMERGTGAYRAVLDEFRDRPEMSRGQLLSSDLPFLHENYFANLPRDSFPASRLIDGIRDGYRDIGIELEKLPISTVIQDIPAGGFCFTIDPGKDVRILANPRDGQSWYQILFHEFGHAVHGSVARGDGHYFVALGDPGFFWEGIAVLFEKASLRTEYLRKYVPDEQLLGKFAEGVRKRLAFRMRRLAFEALFEFTVYLDPASFDALTSRRAEMLRKYFLVEPAVDPPTWTHEIFHITHPCYIQNYVLAEMMAFHILETAGGPDADPWRDGLAGRVVEKLLVPGGMESWKTKIESLTGHPMTPDAFLRQVFP